MAKELFTSDKILLYLTKDNPFVYSSIGEAYIKKEQANYFLGAFDTKLLATYDDKDYPLTQGEFFDVSLAKPIENGMEFSLGYREAQGIQEYNNIKTGEEGEVRTGLKIPVFSVINNISKRKLNLNSASMEATKFKFKSENNLRILYFDILSKYQRLLYTNTILTLQSELLATAKKREVFIKKKVEVGSIADIALLEAQQQIINRKQRFVSAQNDFAITLREFLKYFKLSKKEFDQQYTLPALQISRQSHTDLEDVINLAIQNRPDLKVFDYEMKKMSLQQKYTNVLKFPNLNLSFHGVHDYQYGNGFKVSLDMDFPIERRKYQAQHAKIKMNMINIENNKRKEIITIKTNLTNIINSLKNLDTNIESSKAEVALVEKLQELENKKFRLGRSNLFMVNQREIYTLTIKKKLLKYILKYLLLQQAEQKETGKAFVTMKDLV